MASSLYIISPFYYLIKMRKEEIISSFDNPYTQLPASITPVDNNIRTGRVRAGVTRQIQIDTLQLAGIRVPSHRRQRVPPLLHLKRTVAADGRVDVAWADYVDPSKARPLDGQ